MAMPMLASSCSASLPFTSAKSALLKPQMLHDKMKGARNIGLPFNWPAVIINSEQRQAKPR